MLRFKHLLFTICAVVFAVLSATAQTTRDSKRFEAIENEKVAYITKELNLSPNEAQHFFPLYNQYNKEMWELKSAKTGSSATPRGVNSLNGSGKRDILSYDSRELEIKKEYRKKFAEVIGNSRASEFFEIEQNFRELLYKELRRRNK
ncbi:hypothetical protein PQ465_04150 [Sphingobacterium oryzagri]|uniref:DUF4168 domain-containing protein n=1 Tax=Sphingobacterium oryzagri TaxID=3025669 RepID=A0ABY7WJ85_9SPHI|nr:hypothetical protein [Sphingobacterium sp. KACC 22765]WDF69575.1 hypothetical protein PQ465_04150 [Sphingobacterium sp. KACC 22765]